MQDLLHNQVFVFGAMAIIIFALTQIIKIPIKFFTNKIGKNATTPEEKIKAENVRKKVNATILLIPFALGILFEFLLCNYVTFLPFNITSGIAYGSSGVSVYGIIERFIGSKNPYKTSEGEAVQQLVGDITADGKVDENDRDALQAFWDKVK